jgi:hypothetical protein
LSTAGANVDVMNVPEDGPPDRRGVPATPAEELKAMPSDAVGCWVVRTAATTHLFDFDVSTYSRRPDEGRKAMPHDGRWLALRGVRGAPAVGGQFTVYVDVVDRTGAIVDRLWRMSATVTAIRNVDRATLDAFGG